METLIAMIADFVIVGGTIHLEADGSQKTDAIAVGGGRVIAVGAADVEKKKGAKTRVVDLQGRTVIPGFIDAHAHLVSLARSLAVVDLKGVASYEAAVARVAARAKTTKAGAWVVGRGWDQNLWGMKGFPHHDALSKATPDHPVYLSRVDGHAALLNRRGLAAVGLDPTRPAPPDPAGGRIERDDAGLPTGVLVDKAMDAVSGKVERPKGEALAALVKEAQTRVAAAGIVEVHEMGIGEAELNVLRALAREGALTVRLVVYIDGEDPATLLAQENRGVEARIAGGMLAVRGAKFFADGALGSRGAALLEPYSDDAKNAGLLTRDKASLTAAIARATKAGLQVAIHAIGDRANRVVLEALEAQTAPTKPERPRIEHAQVVHEDDVKRFAALGVVASMQPTHCTSDMAWAPARLGEKRVPRAYAWRSMLEAKVPLAFGSDFPVEEVEPILGLVAATLRADGDGYPTGGWNPWQRLTSAQALSAFSAGAAFAAFEEKEAGSLTVGKRADLVVVSEDPLAISAADLRDVRVEMTVVGGRVVFETP
ncbi:MAG: amidohydrolase [Deltaproteobacteria bacterium]|nr:amidohydrolase [Deltaproteobacteria bacterium]